jgi:hypothetical protein
MDGNFKADHAKMRSPEKDVSLRDGRAFMAEEKRYYEHIKASQEETPKDKQVCNGCF